ncbi:hypothetical protein NDU88_001542 [Pleurodeles waltl]|uniref:Uncharacterized protein n=1 Tax=Pleurodeles waltl TaxID=8319 RepID=A0AAV7UT20_PLEWA|nr:hypothetical protein NDU88_001542 [Pleurodeles waltl]
MFTDRPSRERWIPCELQGTVDECELQGEEDMYSVNLRSKPALAWRRRALKGRRSAAPRTAAESQAVTRHSMSTSLEDPERDSRNDRFH